MSEHSKSAEKILEAASPKVRKVVNEILSIEHEFQSYQNIRAAGSVEKEIAKRIKQLIEREVKR